MGWKFRARKSWHIAPFVWLNVTQAGRWSITVRVWRWSWNSRLGQQRFDTPGPGYVVGSTRAQRERKRAGRQ